MTTIDIAALRAQAKAAAQGAGAACGPSRV